MRDPAQFDAVLQCANDVFLPDEIAKSLATIFSVKGNVRHEELARFVFDNAGRAASPRGSTYRCYLPVLAGFIGLLPRSSRRCRFAGSFQVHFARNDPFSIRELDYLPAPRRLGTSMIVSPDRPVEGAKFLV